MKILICPDSFKGSIGAGDAAAAIRRGILSVRPDVTAVCLPVADGGEGTLDALVGDGDRVTVSVSGPDGVSVSAPIGRIGDLCVIEMASAAGLTLLPEGARNPMHTTTRGVGELILHALNLGCRRFLLTLGGSATNDGGMGMLIALGARVTDENGQTLVGVGGDLCRASHIDISGLDARLYECTFTVATDVKNPLTGERGATRIYGAQKGASPAELDLLEDGMCRFANLLASVGRDVVQIPGSGAAGGMSAPLLSLFPDRVTLRSGIDCVLDACGFDAELWDADLVISGEGRTDGQSAEGKVVCGIAKRAKAAGVPLDLICGCTGDGFEALYPLGVRSVRTLMETGCTTEYAMTHPAELLERVASELVASV